MKIRLASLQDSNAEYFTELFKRALVPDMEIEFVDVGKTGIPAFEQSVKADQQTVVIVFYQSPGALLRLALQNKKNLVGFHKLWIEYGQLLSRLCADFRSQVLLFNEELAIENYQSVIDHTKTFLSCEARASYEGPEVTSRTEENLLLDLMVDGALYQMGRNLELQAELYALAHPLGEVNEPQTAIDAAVTEYFVKIQDAQGLVTENAELASTRDNALKSMDDLKKKSGELNAELTESQQENDLLLLQLHRVQEELEQSHLAEEKTQEQASQLKVLTEEKAQLIAARDSAQKEVTILKREAEGRSEKLTKLQQQFQEQVSELKALAEENAQLIAAGDSTQNEVIDLKKQADESKAELTDTQQENELLLLQLHQVQEELEHYFLQYKEVEVKIQGLDRKYQSVALRYPEYLSAGKVTLMGGQLDGDNRHLNVRLENLEHFDENWPAVLVKFHDQQGKPGIEFRPSDNQNAMPLDNWQETARDKFSALMLLSPENPESQAVMNGLSSSDYLRVLGICELVVHKLRTSQYERTEKTRDINPKDWLQRIENLADQLRSQADKMRFDRSKLIGAYKADGYEHLWIQLENLLFAGRFLPSLQFKLQAKGVQGDAFSSQGCLAFRDQEGGLSPFMTWPPLRSDEYGPVLQLDFVNNPGEKGQADWQSLFAEDKQFLNGLLQNLLRVIDALEASGEELNRPWSQWTQLVETMRAFLPDHAQQDTGKQVSAPKETRPEPKAAFATAELGEEFVGKNYEHLRLDISHLDTPVGKYATYGFKLGALNSADSAFAEKLILEFRPSDALPKPLECWDKAPTDEHGKRLRLFFGEALSAEEQADWSCLSEKDRQLLGHIQGLLPALVTAVGQTAKIKRSWDDWQAALQRHLQKTTDA
jgi:uncharacterized coiled-coil DUF342 family protein